MSGLLVSQIFIYPVKSLGGISVQEAEVLPKGLAMDRRMMLVDESLRFITQRQFPALSLFRTSISEKGNGFLVAHRGCSIEVPQAPAGPLLKAMVWDDAVEVHEVSPLISEWFSDQLKLHCRLVSFPEENPRAVDPDYALHPSNQTSLSDGFPLLIIGQASLDDLNGRLEQPLPINRFRPNLVFDGGGAFEEDGWGQFSVGNIRLAVVKPCGRCVITTIDQQTGLAGREPLATLSSYRKVGNKLMFGQNVIPIDKGVIRVGDSIKLG